MNIVPSVSPINARSLVMSTHSAVKGYNKIFSVFLKKLKKKENMTKLAF